MIWTNKSKINGTLSRLVYTQWPQLVINLGSLLMKSFIKTKQLKVAKGLKSVNNNKINCKWLKGKILKHNIVEGGL